MQKAPGTSHRDETVEEVAARLWLDTSKYPASILRLFQTTRDAVQDRELYQEDSHAYISKLQECLDTWIKEMSQIAQRYWPDEEFSEKFVELFGSLFSFLYSEHLLMIHKKPRSYLWGKSEDFRQYFDMPLWEKMYHIMTPRLDDEDFKPTGLSGDCQHWTLFLYDFFQQSLGDACDKINIYSNTSGDHICLGIQMYGVWYVINTFRKPLITRDPTKADLWLDVSFDSDCTQEVSEILDGVCDDASFLCFHTPEEFFAYKNTHPSP